MSAELSRLAFRDNFPVKWCTGHRIIAPHIDIIPHHILSGGGMVSLLELYVLSEANSCDWGWSVRFYLAKQLRRPRGRHTAHYGPLSVLADGTDGVSQLHQAWNSKASSREGRDCGILDSFPGGISHRQHLRLHRLLDGLVHSICIQVSSLTTPASAI